MIGRVVVVALLLAVVAADAARAQDEVEGMTEPGMGDGVRSHKLKTVVLGLEGRRGVDAGLAEALTDIVQGVYARQRDRVVLGRKDLERVLGFEETKQAVGCTDESCLSEIASALDADRLVSGSLDKIGTTYLFVLSELDARKLAPIGRTEHQLATDEAGLIPAVRDATEAFLGRAGAQPEMNVGNIPDATPAEETEPAAADGDVPLLHWAFAGAKLVSGTLGGVTGALLFGSGFILVTTDDNGDPLAPGVEPTPDDWLAASLCWVPGGILCIGSSVCFAWGVTDLLFPPGEPAPETTKDARATAPPEPPRAASRVDVMAH